MARTPPPTIDDIVIDLAAAIPHGLDRLTRRDLLDTLDLIPPQLVEDLLRQRDALRPDYPHETLTPMLGASALAAVLRAGVDDDVRGLPVPRQRRPWRWIAALVLVAGVGSWYVRRRRSAGDRDPTAAADATGAAVDQAPPTTAS